jgi:cell division protein FtsQ
VRKVSWWILLGMLAMLGIAVLAAFGVPQTLGTSAAVALGEAGFAVKRVEVKGLDRMAKLPVYSVALDQESMAMPLVDLEGTRARLLKFGWIKDARVSRRLPDTLVVDIVERKPAAIWQHNQRLALIDAEGVVLEAVKLEAMPDLPVVIGAAANRHVPELSRLIDGAPQLKPMMAGASWVGGRRWDIRFQSGEVLALPEGAAAGKALTHFARLDQATQLLGRGFVRFDMRVPGKMIIRVSGVPGSSVPSLAPDIELSAAGADPAPAPAPRRAPPLPVSNEPVDPRKTI